MKLIHSQIFFLLFSTILFAQTDSLKEALKYYPLEKGNKWIYKEVITENIYPFSVINRKWGIEVLKDTLMPNNKKYKKLLTTIFTKPENYEYSFERIDSIEKKVYQYTTLTDLFGSEYVVFDASLKSGDTSQTSKWKIIFEKIYNDDVLNQKVSIRHYNFLWGLIGYSKHYAEGLGLSKQSTVGDFFSSTSILVGCIIDNITYGDTTITSINNYDPVPLNYFLLQNYPNPFNSGTMIKYNLPISSWVTLKIYDLLGKEIETLVNEYKQAGVHVVTFHGTALPSGVYFYRLTANNFSLTKKLILLK